MRKVRLATPPPPPDFLCLPRFSRGWKLLAYPFCVLQPGAGLLLGVLYALQSDPQARRFGRFCLALSVLGYLVHFSAAGRFEALDGAESFLQPFN